MNETLSCLKTVLRQFLRCLGLGLEGCWGGFLSADLTGKINALFRRLVRFGYLCNNLTVSDLLVEADT